MFGSQLGIVFLYAAVIMLAFMLAWILIVPFKAVKKILLNIVLGTICIMLYNYIGAATGGYNHIGINLYTTSFLGVLGVPGFVAIAIIKAII